MLLLPVACSITLTKSCGQSSMGDKGTTDLETPSLFWVCGWKQNIKLMLMWTSVIRGRNVKTAFVEEKKKIL